MGYYLISSLCSGDFGAVMQHYLSLLPCDLGLRIKPRVNSVPRLKFSRQWHCNLAGMPFWVVGSACLDKGPRLFSRIIYTVYPGQSLGCDDKIGGNTWSCNKCGSNMYVYVPVLLLMRGGPNATLEAFKEVSKEGKKKLVTSWDGAGRKPPENADSLHKKNKCK